MVLTPLNGGSDRIIMDLPLVCDFPEVFPYGISDFLLEGEVGFFIDLVPGTSPVSMARYRMSTSDLSEMEKQLEDLIVRKFV